MNVTATIKSIDAVKSDPWQGPQGDIWFVQGYFSDGGIWSLGHKSYENAKKRHSELSPLIGQEGQFEVEQKGEYKGNPKFKLLAWPGKPERPGFGGGGGGQPGGGGGQRAPYQPRYRDTPEGTRSEQDSIHRSVALQMAVAWLPRVDDKFTSSDVTQVADVFYAWLSQGQPPLPTQAPAASSGPPTQPSTGSYDPLKEQKEFFGEGTQSLPTRSKAVDKYLEEIAAAVKIKDADRIAKLSQMINQSLEKRSITLADIDQWINPAIISARQALQGAAEVDAW